MKSVSKLIQRFAVILLCSILLFVGVNIFLLYLAMRQQVPNASPWRIAEETAQSMHVEDGSYSLPKNLSDALIAQDIWGIFISNDTMHTVWQTDNLPDNIPSSYTPSAIASLTRGYLGDYPTFTGAADGGLLVLGYPPKSYWKHLWPSWEYEEIINLPKTILMILLANMAMLFLIYAVANTQLLASIKPIVNGIQALPDGQAVHIRETGLLSEIAANINRTAEILQSQAYQLRKKETARANWIAGVSHDLRTPLSMIMGHAGQLAEHPHLSDACRHKAAVIVKQSGRMRNLIQDLNLASKLEYNMQPLHLSRENIIAIVRRAAVDFINMVPEEKYPIVWETPESLTACFVNADKNLIRRAVSNLIQNCISHNGQGCSVFICVSASPHTCCIEISDDGRGASQEELAKLNHTPHYMVCDENTEQQRHGLGLLIVRQVAASHGGTTEIGTGTHGGFSVKIMLPLLARCQAPKGHKTKHPI